MAIDTVKLRSPEIDEGTAQFLENQCVLKQGIQLSTGDVLYELTSGNLEGSWDSRISFKVCREDWIANRNGKLEKISCKPYVIVEASIHKFFYGQNIYGGPCDFQESCRIFVNLLGEMLSGGKYDQDMIGPHGLFTAAANWQVRRVDWAEMFRLPPAAQDEFFRALKNCKFPRRALKEAKYDTAVHFPGKFTTVRIYGKGAEFKKHDFPRLRVALLAYAMRQAKDTNSIKNQSIINHSIQPETIYPWIQKKLNALQRLANNRLRAEVQINADKLHYDFKGRYPLVSEITDDYLLDIFKDQIFKLLKEGKSDMETVRTYDQVQARLNLIHGKRAANNLFSFWMKLAARGEEVVRHDYSKSQFCKCKRSLIDAGVSWHSSDVLVIPQDTALPRDFVPMPSDARRCTGSVSNDSVFNFCPVEQYRLRKAA